MSILFKPGLHPYPMVRAGGSFLVILGVGLLIGVMTATNGVVNVTSLAVGALLGLISMPIVRKTWWLVSPGLSK